MEKKLLYDKKLLNSIHMILILIFIFLSLQLIQTWVGIIAGIIATIWFIYQFVSTIMRDIRNRKDRKKINYNIQFPVLTDTLCLILSLQRPSSS